MDNHVRIYRIVPKPDVNSEDFETFFVENVLPAVDTGPTRGGQINRSSFYEDVSSQRQDRYLWLIYWFGTDARWVDLQLQEAMEKLRTVGIPLYSTVLIERGASGQEA
jgi:hypothetical protein